MVHELPIEIWYNEALKYGVPVYTSEQNSYLFYKGFKITKHSSNQYTIEDVRLSDFYSPVKSEHLELINDNGFIKGVDIISYQRNLKRVINYEKKLIKLNNILTQIENNLYVDSKKLINCQENIVKYNSLLHLYKAQIEQYKNKYNIKLN